jgi:dipeptidyl aminopeptidase/acylaminoacyl peptidase
MAAVVLRPRNPPSPGACTKVILFPHGGPHAAYVCEFLPGLALFAALGAIVIIPNYRGSLNYGEQFVTSLVGNICSWDVADCLSCVDAALPFLQDLNPESTISVCGGSHGGFLALHLAAAAPERFRCAVARNPVCDIPAMLATTDIPDWCYLETLGDLGQQPLVTAQQVARMFTLSPISKIESIHARLLLLVGAKDKRVPPSQVYDLAPCSSIAPLHVYLRAGHQFSRLYEALGQSVRVGCSPRLSAQPGGQGRRVVQHDLDEDGDDCDTRSNL